MTILEWILIWIIALLMGGFIGVVIGVILLNIKRLNHDSSRKDTKES